MSRLMQKQSCRLSDTQDQAVRIQDQDFLSGVNPQLGIVRMSGLMQKVILGHSRRGHLLLVGLG